MAPPFKYNILNINFVRKEKKMANILNLFNKFFGLNKVTEGYIGLTSFEASSELNIKRPELPELDDETPKSTSLTGILRRAN